MHQGQKSDVFVYCLYHGLEQIKAVGMAEINRNIGRTKKLI